MVRKTFLLPSGEEADYDIKDEETAVHVLALTPENNVILEKGFKPGTEKILLDMPAGFVDEGELPKDAAKRELTEELGMEGEIELAGTSMDDAYSNTIRFTYVAQNCVRVAEPKLDKDEIFEVVEMSVEDFRKHLRSGLITHVEAGYIALDFLKKL